MAKTGPKLKSKREHKRDVEHRLIADEMASAMMSADLGYVAGGRPTPRIQAVWDLFVAFAGKYA